MLQPILRAPRTAEDFALGAQLAKMQSQPIGPAEVARVLSDAKVNYVIVGAHAANGYTGRPRATIDVDVIVEHPKKAATAIAAAFPHLQIEDVALVTRFKDRGNEVIDLMKPGGSPLWKRLLKTAVTVPLQGSSVRIPPVEGMLAAKFAAMASANRRYADKLIDAGDFVRIVEANPSIDEATLEEFGELVYIGGGKEILGHVANVRAGQPLKF